MSTAAAATAKRPTRSTISARMDRLPAIYGFAAVIAVSMGLLSFAVAHPDLRGREPPPEPSRRRQPA